MNTEKHKSIEKSVPNKINSIIGGFKNNGKLLGGVSAVGGFVADVMQPVAPFAEYLFYIFTSLSLLILFVYFIVKYPKEKIISILTLSITMSFVSAGIWSMQAVSGNNNGFLSEIIPIIKSLQSSIGIIEKNIADLKKDTTEIKKTTKEISNKIDKLGSKLGKQGGLISEPETQEEWYNNARIYEIRGDYGNARRTYLKYFSFNNLFIDPHLRFQRFLKIQEGRAGAREIYYEMFEENDNTVVNYAKLLLKDNKSKRNDIAHFLKVNPTFALGYYELSRLYSKNVLGEQTLSDKQAEIENLKEFINLNKKGMLVRYFIDKEEVTKLINKANSKLVTLKFIGKDTFENPITVQATRASNGWNLNISVAETSQEIYYKLENDMDYTSLGVLDYIDPLTKRPLSNPLLTVSGLESIQIIKIKYRDLKGDLKGPFNYKFDPEQALKLFQVSVLKRMPTSWVSFRKFNGTTAYFTHLLSYRCGLLNIKYGINKDLPNLNYFVPKCDFTKPYTLPDNNLYIKLATDVKFLTVQVIYSTGEKSKIQHFKVPTSL